MKATSKEDRKSVLPNHLGKSADFIVKYLPVKSSPRGISIAPDGLAAYVANAIDDSLTVINLKTLQPAARIDLGGAKVITKQRFGERAFHNANIAFRKQFSCHSCHPDGHVDGLTYDIEADGIGVSPVENRTLRGILDTAPFKWKAPTRVSRGSAARASPSSSRATSPSRQKSSPPSITTSPPSRARPTAITPPARNTRPPSAAARRFSSAP